MTKNNTPTIDPTIVDSVEPTELLTGITLLTATDREEHGGRPCA